MAIKEEIDEIKTIEVKTTVYENNSFYIDFPYICYKSFDSNIESESKRYYFTKEEILKENFLSEKQDSIKEKYSFFKERANKISTYNKEMKEKYGKNIDKYFTKPFSLDSKIEELNEAIEEKETKTLKALDDFYKKILANKTAKDNLIKEFETKKNDLKKLFQEVKETKFDEYADGTYEEKNQKDEELFNEQMERIKKIEDDLLIKKIKDHLFIFNIPEDNIPEDIKDKTDKDELTKISNELNKFKEDGVRETREILNKNFIKTKTNREFRKNEEDSCLSKIRISKGALETFFDEISKITFEESNEKTLETKFNISIEKINEKINMDNKLFSDFELRLIKDTKELNYKYTELIDYRENEGEKQIKELNKKYKEAITEIENNKRAAIIEEENNKKKEIEEYDISVKYKELLALIEIKGNVSFKLELNNVNKTLLNSAF